MTDEGVNRGNSDEVRQAGRRDPSGCRWRADVAAVTHCATRLRFQIMDRDKVDKAAVEYAKGVITVVEAGGQFQVVIGNTVSNVYE